MIIIINELNNFINDKNKEIDELKQIILVNSTEFKDEVVKKLNFITEKNDKHIL